MAPPDLPIAFQPLWFVPAFLVLWLVSAAIMSRIAGWKAFASDFPMRVQPDAQSIRFVSGSLGNPNFPIRYRSCLHLHIGRQGLGVALMFPFNFQSPAFMVPWQDIESVDESQFMSSRSVHIRIRGHHRLLSLKGAIAQHVVQIRRAALPDRTA